MIKVRTIFEHHRFKLTNEKFDEKIMESMNVNFVFPQGYHSLD